MIGRSMQAEEFLAAKRSRRTLFGQELNTLDRELAGFNLNGSTGSHHADKLIDEWLPGVRSSQMHEPKHDLASVQWKQQQQSGHMTCPCVTLAGGSSSV